jgi:hypothetical protein
MMEPRRKPLLHRPGFARQQAQPGIDAVGRRMQFGVDDHVAAVNAVLRHALARQIERAAISRLPSIRRFVLDMQRTDACGEALRADQDTVVDMDRAGQNGAGDDHADA